MKSAPHESKTQMPVLFVVPDYSPAKCIPSFDYVFPLGLAYVISALQEKGIAVEALNLNHEFGKPAELLKKRLDAQEYSVVCTGGTSMMFNDLDSILSVASQHHSRPTTILGGIVVTSEPEVVFNAINPDFAVVGEAEDAAVELIEAVLSGEEMGRIPGVMFLRDGELVKIPARAKLRDIDSIPFPNLEMLGFEEWLDNQASTGLSEKCRSYPILGSRGCPFRCTFCYHFEKHRQRSLDSIFAELEEAIPKYRIDVIDLYDDCFALKKDRLEEFCDRMQTLRDKVGWTVEWTVQLTVKKINADILQRLKDAGCVCVSYGFESFSDSVLKSMRKPIAKDEIRRALDLTLKHKLIIRANFIFGDVSETCESYKETLKFWRESCLGQVNLDRIMLYPGSIIYEDSVKRGIVEDRLSFLQKGIRGEQPINFTKNMSDDEYLTMLYDVFEHRRRHGAFSISCSVQKKGLRYDVAVKCPFCGKQFICTNLALTQRFSGLSFASFHCACRGCVRRFVVMSLTGYLWMQSKSLRYRLLRVGRSVLPVKLVNLLGRGLEHAP